MGLMIFLPSKNPVFSEASHTLSFKTSFGSQIYRSAITENVSLSFMNLFSQFYLVLLVQYNRHRKNVEYRENGIIFFSTSVKWA